MKILVACEESQTVCKAFRARGFEAYSCDLQDCSGGHPEWHIKGDCLDVINQDWDLVIAHPPCTYLSNVATRHHSLRMTPLKKINKRTLKRIEAMAFFMKFVECSCPRIAIENPVGVMNTCYRKPDQIIEPYFFAKSSEDKENYVTKKTCLWLKGLPLITYVLPQKPNNADIFGRHCGSGKARNWEETTHGAKTRSKTFLGIAEAMATQWGDFLITNANEHNEIFTAEELKKDVKKWKNEEQRE